MGSLLSPSSALQIDRDRVSQLFEWLQIGTMTDEYGLHHTEHLAIEFINSFESLKQDDEVRARQLKEYLDSVYEVVETFDEMKMLGKYHRFSKGDLSAWWDMVGKQPHQALQRLLPKKLGKEEYNKWADRVMMGFYIGFNIITLAIGGFACGNVTDLGKFSFLLGDTANTVIASSWNYIDVIGGVVQGWHEIKLGNYGRGTAAIVSSTQLAASTMAANIGAHVTHTVGAAGVAGLTGFSLAACMYIAMITELVTAHQISQTIKLMEAERDKVAGKIKRYHDIEKEIALFQKQKSQYQEKMEKLATLKKEYDTFKRDTLPEQGQLAKLDRSTQDYYLKIDARYKREIQQLEKETKAEGYKIDRKKSDIAAKEVNLDGMDIQKLKNKLTLYNKSIVHEKAKRQNHYRAAKSWGACAIGMTAVAVVAFIVANGATFGAATGLAVGVAAVAVISSLVRSWWVQKQNYVDKLKVSLDGSLNLQERIDKLDFEALGKKFKINFNQRSSHQWYQFHRTDKTLKTYVEEMQYKDPEKAKKLVEALEDKDKSAFIRALKQQRGTFSTEGEDLYKKLGGDETPDGLSLK